MSNVRLSIEDLEVISRIKDRLQSLSQYPTEFEQDKIKKVDALKGIYYEPETTTNAQGQTVWVGKYK